MAKLYTDLANDQTPAEGANTWSRNPGILETGILLHREATYTLTDGTDEASSDKLYICKIPAGCRIRPDLFKIVAEDPGTAFNLATIGVEEVDGGTDLNDADQLSGAIDISAGGIFSANYAATVEGLTGVTATQDMWLYATLGTITAPTAGKKVRFLVTLAAGV